ncbi:GTP pyrophosphokinase family protein [Planctomycetota bacterium]
MGDLREAYELRRVQFLTPLAKELEEALHKDFDAIDRIDRIVARAKTVDSFMKKAAKEERGIKKYDDPLNQIQDQVGARIVSYYLDDIERIQEVVFRYYRHIEERTVVPDSESEFGYFGKHFILLLPKDLINGPVGPEGYPNFFELQIKTLFQHAWGEANHDLGYKPAWEWESEDKRQIAFASAQAWGADMVFNGLHRKCGQATEL